VVLFGMLYASEGAPIGFIWWALPTLLRSEGVPLDRITSLTALLLLPWVLKFLWAPLLDGLRGPRWGYRSWLIAMQIVMAAALLPLIALDPIADFGWWRVLLLLHAVAAATQDVAIDALAIGAVPAEERGRLNGAMQAGMLIGRSVFGGGVLILGVVAGHGAVVAALAAWIVAALIAALSLREWEPPRGGAGSFGVTLRDALQRWTTWLGLGFAVIAAAAFEATGQLAGPYLVDRAVASRTIGVFFGVFVVIAMLVGGVAGGLLADRRDRVSAVSLGMAGFIGTIVTLAVVDLGGGHHAALLIGLLTVMYFFVGVFTASSYALFMDLTQPRVGATQFSAFMAATNACESWSAWSGGAIASAEGYPAAFLVMCGASLLGWPLLHGMRRAGAERDVRLADSVAVRCHAGDDLDV
jgi:MFS family permease